MNRNDYQIAGSTAGQYSAIAQQGSILNQINEALLDDAQIYLATEEGYLIVEQDNKNNFIIQED